MPFCMCSSVFSVLSQHRLPHSSTVFLSIPQYSTEHFHLNWDQAGPLWTLSPALLDLDPSPLLQHSLPAKKLPVNARLFTAALFSHRRRFLKVNIPFGTLRLNCTLSPFNLTAPAAFLVKSTVHYWDPFYEGAVRCSLMNLWHKAPFQGLVKE